MEPKITSKRIVSKSAYVRQILRRAVYTALSILLCIVVVVLVVLLLPILVLCAIVDVLTVLRSPAKKWLYGQGNTQNPSPSRMSFLISEGMVTLVQVASRSFKAAQKMATQIDSCVPLTRANTTNLPAPDSLVRASSEPMQAQESVLLRAAAEGQETQSEQLVRAVNGQE